MRVDDHIGQPKLREKLKAAWSRNTHGLSSGIDDFSAEQLWANSSAEIISRFEHFNGASKQRQAPGGDEPGDTPTTHNG